MPNQQKSLADLIEELIESKQELREAQENNAKARDKYFDVGGQSWGYYGSGYYDAIHEAEAKIQNIKKELNEYGR